MRLLRWMFTKEGGAATPRLSAVSAALLAGALAGVFFSLRMGDASGAMAGLGFAAVCFRVIYPALREEHQRQRMALGAVRASSVRPNLVRLGVLFAALPIGTIVSFEVGSPWGVALVMVGALIAVVVMRAVSGR
jgi:hypothetical protein